MDISSNYSMLGSFSEETWTWKLQEIYSKEQSRREPTVLPHCDEISKNSFCLLWTRDILKYSWILTEVLHNRWKKNWTEKRINWTRSDNLFACSTEKQFWPSVQHWKKTRGDLSRGVFRNISKHTIFCLCCLCLHFACPIKTIKGGFSFQRTLVDGCLPSYVPYLLPYLKHTQVLELCNLIPTRMRH